MDYRAMKLYEKNLKDPINPYGIPKNKLQDMNDDEAKAIFQFRSRMANFHGNYRSKTNDLNPIDHCPLCFSHPDTQQWSFQCPVLRKNIVINGQYENILNGNIDKNLAKTAKSILKYREMSL